jgi:hypothetical protein
MSQADLPQNPDDNADDWAELAEHTDTLEMLIEKETALEDHARTLLSELEKRGYR